MKNYNHSNYNLFVAEDNCQNYLVLEENAGYNHCVFDWDLSDEEISATAHKFHMVGLTDDDMGYPRKKKKNFREGDYNSFRKVELPSIKVYVNDPGDPVILLHMGTDENIWAYMSDEETVSFLVSFFEGKRDADMEPFTHPWHNAYYTDEEIEGVINGLELVADGYTICSEVNEEWPVYSILRRAGLLFDTEEVVTVHGHIPTDEDLEDAADYMDDECRDDLHIEVAPCSPEYFLREYINRYSGIDPDFEDVMREEFRMKWVPLQ